MRHRRTTPRDEALRLELLRRAEHPAAPGNADRLWDVLDEYEAWPGFQLGDVELQRRCLDHLEAAVDWGDAPPGHYACLDDRIRMSDGKPQRYGSQFVVTGQGTLVPWPIEEAERVDVRRARMGMVPLAVQQAQMQAEYHEHGRPLWPVTTLRPD